MKRPLVKPEAAVVWLLLSLEVQFQSKLNDAIWFTQRVHISRTREGRCAAAELAEEAAGNRWRALR